MRSSDVRTVLIVARDPVIGALMGELVALCDHHAMFPRSDERPMHALERLDPGFVLVDADHEISASAEFLAACTAKARLIFFSGGMNARELERFASVQHALSFPLPNGPRRLSETLAQAEAR